MNAWFPRLNVRGDIASGNNGIWLTPADGSPPRQVSPVGDGPIWAGDTLVFNRNDGTTQVGGAVLPVAYNDYRGSDDGRWAGFMPGAGGRGVVDLYNGAELIQSEPTACAPRFASDRFAYLRPYQSEDRVLYINGAAIASGRINDVVLQRNGAFTVWQLATGTYTRSLASDRPIVTIRNDEAPIAAFLAPDGSPWIVTGTRLTGGVLFVRPLDSPMGYVLRGILMFPDTRMIGNRLRLVASGDDGSPRFDNWIDFSAPREDLRLIADPPPPVVIPTFSFSHPVIVAPFKAAGSGLPDLFSLGVYSESVNPEADLASAAAQGKRLLLGHDALADWMLPSGLRPWDVPMIELYLTPAETLDESVVRWQWQMLALRLQWPVDCGVIPMMYDQFRWTVAQMLDGLRHLSEIVNLSPRIKVIAPFEFDRENGITAHPELQAALANLRAAATAAGLAVLQPIGGAPVPPPHPKPKPVPPHEEISMAVTQVAGVIHYVSKKPSAQAGCTNYILPDGQVFSALDDGNHGQPAGTVGSSRPAGSDGPWEQGQESGAIATFNANGYYTFLLAPVDRLTS